LYVLRQAELTRQNAAAIISYRFLRTSEPLSVRKRKWATGKGVEKEAWVVDYVDGEGNRRLKTFARKKDADAFSATARVEIREGTHVADSASVTVKQAGDLWIASAINSGLEPTTIDQYRQHLGLHIAPVIGNTLLSKLNVPAVRAFEDRLREHRSPAMVKKVLGSLGSLLADAQERGLVVRNAVRDMRGRRRRGKERQSERRQKGKLKVGVDLPLPAEIRVIVENVRGRWRPLILTAIFAGLRASELRGLRWSDIDFEKRLIHVRQRADRFNTIGRPKSVAGERVVPLPPMLADSLREWKRACPRSDLDLLFPNGAGKIESLANIINRGLIPPQLTGGIITNEGKAKYTGMHCLRHFYASWLINRREDGGLGLPPKIVQEHLGHATITITLDTYGHLFPRGDDTAVLAAAERELLGLDAT
jgi:integrase